MKAYRIGWLFFAMAWLLPGVLAAQQAEGREVDLETAHRMALAQNHDMKNIVETVKQAEILVYKAWTILMPNLIGSGSVTVNEDEVAMQMPSSDGSARKIVIQDKVQQSLGITANMALFNARSIPLILNAYDNRHMARVTGRHQRNELLFAVTAAYYTIASNEEALKAAEDDLVTAQEFLKLAQSKLAVGQGVRIDVLRAELEVVEAEKQVQNAQDALKLAKTSLAYLTGLKGDYEIVAPASPEAVTGGLDDLQQKALRDRLDLKSTRIQKVMVGRDETETWTKWVPLFDVTYQWNWNSAAGFSGQKDSWLLIFGASWNLFEGGSKFAELAERKSISRQSRNQVNKLILSIKEEVEKALLELEKSRRNVNIAEKQAELANEQFRLVQKQFKIGLATSLDMREATTALSKARLNQVIESLMHDMAVLSLNKSVGEYYSLAGTADP